MNAMTGFAAYLSVGAMTGQTAEVVAKPLSRTKRALDIALVLFALPVLVPVFLALALAIKLTSAGPVFFVQQRVGRGGKAFGMIKFRSMVVNAEALRSTVLETSDRDGLCFKSKDDPRITKVGKILRRASLDELPQLINVLKGEMSLVGPRPALPEEVAAYPRAALERLAVLPGITGPWQVSGRADLGFDEMVALDVAYVRDHSVIKDIRILAKTINAVASGRGAY
jgi:lipopolysaccharide/colanic/teichoic acid biosynthesis glycosyltransferase